MMFIKPLRSAAVLLLLLFPCCAWTQAVPASVLEQISKTYTDKGMKLEKTYEPDMNRKAVYTSGACYPGKKVTVVAVLAAKPKDWLFKLRYNNTLINKKDKLAPLSIEGSNYWLNTISAHVPAPALKKNSDKCMTILAYDKSAIRLPVYLLVFTSDN